jgi:hypothetical protein
VSFVYGGATMLLALGKLLGGIAALTPLIGTEMLMAVWMERKHAVTFKNEAKTG